MIRTWEQDDYPLQRDDVLRMLDAIKARWPRFRANVFCVPGWMKRADWAALEERRDWIAVGAHGFVHIKRECRAPKYYARPRYVKMLDQIARDDRYDLRIFKPPWYGADAAFVQMLQDRRLTVALKTLARMPFPTPTWRMWCVTDLDARIPADPGTNVVAHPIYGTDRSLKAAKTELSEANVERWTRHWSEDDRWEYVDRLTRPMLLKLNLGCGPDHVWNDWACLDPRSHLDVRIIDWDFSRMIPFGANKADIVLTSHVFNYVSDKDYNAAALDIWRVLRPGGVWRMAEDRTDNGYAWSRIGGRSRGTGQIRSMPTRQKVLAAAERVGFQVQLSGPGETISPHKDVLAGDTRSRRWRHGHKFYAEAVKSIEIPDLSRPAAYDERATRRGKRYRMPA